MLQRAQDIFLLIVRVFWGWQFAETGWGKLQHLDKVTQFFTSLGIPFPALNAAFVGGLEFVGGILLILGFGSRIVAILLGLNMMVAYLTDGRPQLLAIFSDASKFYGYDAFPFLFAVLIIAVFGGGRLSVDGLWKPRWFIFRWAQI